MGERVRCAPAPADTLRLEERDAYALITINREAKRNAMDRATRNAMLWAFDRCREKFPVIVVTGTGASFCAGIDLKERVADQEQGFDSAADEWRDVNVAIREHPSVFIAAVNGIALGGGTTLINVCDLAIASDDAQIGTPEMGFSTYPGLAGPSTQLTLNRKRAAWMILTTNRIDGKTAEQWGLVNLCVAHANLLGCADELARQVAKFNPIALCAAKRALDTIPNVITGWAQGFEFGEYTNTWIRSRTSAQSSGLQRFHKGEKNPGQG